LAQFGTNRRRAAGQVCGSFYGFSFVEKPSSSS
jgi:hypothetical protein